jgi:branched-chain amino acid transport system substrate-binding protein
MTIDRRDFTIASLATLGGCPAWAQGKYDPGASNSEIRIGSIQPYSGPASLYGLTGTTQEAYFRMINERGGINGRKVTYISYDDGYSPAKTIEQARKLVESDKVLALFCTLGTATNAAIVKYMNSKQVPHLFLLSGAAKFADPKTHPWTMPWMPNYVAEGRAYAKDILKNRPNAKVGVLYQNDDFGRDYLRGLEEALGDKAKSMIVARLPYETTDPTVDSQLVIIKFAGADVLVLAAVSKFVTQALRKTAEMNWSPTRYISNTAISIDVLKPAGLEKVRGALSAAYMKEPGDPQWNDDAGYKVYVDFMDKYMPGQPRNNVTAVAYGAAVAIAQVLRQSGDDLTRVNVMKQAANLKNLDVGMALPGIKVNTGPSDYTPFSEVQLIEFTGEYWKRTGPVIDTLAL